MLRKLIQAGVLLALSAANAAAQVPPLPDNHPTTPATKEEREQKAADEAYKSAVKRIPAPKTSSDPWGDVRPTAPTAVNKKQD